MAPRAKETQESAGKTLPNRTIYLGYLSERQIKYEFKYLSSTILKHFIGVFHAYKGVGRPVMTEGVTRKVL
jgi:hypothetical protein